MLLMCENSETSQVEPVLAVTLLSGTKQCPDLEVPAYLTRTALNKHVFQGILTQDEKPFHIVLTNLTTAGRLFVEILLGDSDSLPLNAINLIEAGQSIVVDHRYINGIPKELIATSNNTIVEKVLGRKLTPEEDRRCQVTLGKELEGDTPALTFRLEITPTSQTSHCMHNTSDAYWTSMSTFLRREIKPEITWVGRTMYKDNCPVREESDGGDCVDGPPKAYHASLTYGSRVNDVPEGIYTNCHLVRSKSLKNAKLIITVIGEKPKIFRSFAGYTKNQVENKYRLDLEQSKIGVFKPTEACLIDPAKRPNVIFVPCGHICVHTEDAAGTDLLMYKVNKQCPLCHSHIAALIPRHLLHWAA